jgi:8-oxo-dGTP diphosphatase
MKPVKRSVALAIVDPKRPDAVLIVQRPADDEELPNVWGLPAASLRADETWEDAARRAGREKLGVTLDVASELDHSTLERADYTLDMKLFEATIISGMPSIQQVSGVTQYRHCRWGRAADLEEAARRGSLCSTMYLEWDEANREYPGV